MSIGQHREENREEKQQREKDGLHNHSHLGEEAKQEVGDELKESDTQKRDCNHIETPSQDTIDPDGQEKRE